MATQGIDLAQLFGTVAQAMTQNQSTLNQADTYNHDHGDNMVQIFEVITQAMKEKSNSAPADQLAYASQLLRSKSTSGSAKIYADGLASASQKFVGKKYVTPNNATTLIQAMLGAQKKVPVPTAQPSTNSAGGDLLGSILGTLTGMSGAPTPSTSRSGSQSIDIGKLLKAGMTYAQAKQSGSGDLDAIMKAILANSSMNTSEYRTQSGSLVGNTLLQALSQMMAK